MDERPRRVIVTLIHGTWARREWKKVKPDERWPAMQRSLKTLGESVEIHTIIWTGHNRVSARAKAAEEFADYLTKLDVPPDVPHYVIAHSHGGSVVALALRNPANGLRAKVSALVCLSTPFFQVRTRSLGDMKPEIVGAGMLGSGLLLAWLSYRGAPWTWPSLIGRAFAMIVGIIAVAGGLSPIADRVKKKMEIRSLDGVPVFVLRSPSDDATLPLTLLQCLGWGGEWVYWFAHQLARLTSKSTDIVLSSDQDPLIGSTPDQTPRREAQTVKRDRRPIWIQLAPIVYATGFSCSRFIGTDTALPGGCCYRGNNCRRLSWATSSRSPSGHSSSRLP